MSNIKVSKKVPKNMDEKHVGLTLEGELTLQNAKELKKSIQKNIAGYESVNIKADNITQADITFIQILKSLERHLTDKGKKITTNIKYPYDVKTLLANAGIEGES